MNVLLCQLDGKLPNLALMRLAAHHRDRLDRVEFRRTPTAEAVEPEFGDTFDRIYASTIFKRSVPIVEALLAARPDAIVGGTGWNLTTKLEDYGVQTAGPLDYSLYPLFKRSIGFSQRGCRLRCEFCVVPEKEGRPRDEHTIAEIWRGEPYPRELLLLDNDFFGAPGWRRRVEEIRAGKFKVCLTQGINARMITEESAEVLAGLDYRDDSFRSKRIYTAWDNIGDADKLFRGLELLKRFGVKPAHVMVYMLIGFKDSPEDREERHARLREWGALPYPMPYKRTPELVAFQRWVVRRYDKIVTWREFWAQANGDPYRIEDPSTGDLFI